MTDTYAEPDMFLEAFNDAELRFLRKTVSMQQGSLEARYDHASGAERARIERDIRTASTAYAKLQHAINARLLGDEHDGEE